jgi:CheY-like chemotaxis protein
MGSKNRILVVEDNSDVRELLVFLLRRSGFEVIEAATGLEAIDQTRAAHPDLIIMDLGLPTMTGDEATARIKADPSTKHIPVIVNTAFNPNAVFVERAIAAGAAEIMHKPTELKVILQMVRRYLSPQIDRSSVPMQSGALSFQPAVATQR